MLLNQLPRSSRQADKDNSGTITLAELRAQIVQMPAVQQAAVDASGGIDALMQALDLNGDGQVCRCDWFVRIHG